MSQKSCLVPQALIFVLGAAAMQSGAPSAWAADDAPAAESAQGAAKAPGKPDLSGRQRIGKASVYAKRLDGRKMADGTPMQMDSDSAASKTLPLGTKAKVTSLETGRSAVVTIRDRGPYVHGRILDVSPSTARKIGLGPKRGIAKVAVEPITVPLPDGGVKRGDGDT
jgi:rare lipoprotein A